MPNKKLYGKRFAFYLSHDLFNELQKEAEEKDLNLAAYLRSIINERKIKREFR